MGVGFLDADYFIKDSAISTKHTGDSRNVAFVQAKKTVNVKKDELSSVKKP